MSQVPDNDQSGRNSRVVKSSLNAIVGTLLFLGILIGLYWLAGKSNKSIDLTRNKMYTLSNSTKNLLKKVEDRVTITVYATEKNAPPNWTEKRNELRELLAQYRAISNGQVQYSFRSVEPDSETATEAEKAGMQPNLMQESSSSGLSVQKGYFGLQAEYKGKNEVIPIIPLQESLEYQLTRVINKVAAIDIPSIGMMVPQGNPLMGQQSQYSGLKQIFEQEDFKVTDFEPTDLSKLSDVEMLIIVDPQELNEEALFHIDQFVMNGGKLFVAAPGVQLSSRMGMNSVVPNPPNINQLLEYYGLRINPTLVEDWAGGQPRMTMTQAGNIIQYKDPMVFMTVNTSAETAATSNLQALAFAYTSNVGHSDRGTSGTVIPLVQSSENSRLQEGTFTIEATDLKPPTPEEKTAPQDLVMLVKGTLTSRYSENPPPVLNNADGTTKSVEADSIKKRSNGESEVVVAGSSLFLINQILQNALTNALLPLNLAESFTRGGDVLELRARDLGQARLRTDITPAEKTWTQVIIVGGIPVVLILLGFVKLLMNRRKKAKYRRIYAGVSH